MVQRLKFLGNLIFLIQIYIARNTINHTVIDTLGGKKDRKLRVFEALKSTNLIL